MLMLSERDAVSCCPTRLLARSGILGTRHNDGSGPSVCERGRIVRTPRANRASLENELHDSVFVEFDSGLLHFAVRQKPDQRFVVKIDNLNAVAPWVVEVAAERR